MFLHQKLSKAQERLTKNFKSISPHLFKNDLLFNKDIYDLNLNDLPNFDLCCAGFPCQPFSQIGYKKGFKENLEGRGNLFFEIEKIIKEKEPKAFFLENVQHLINHDNGRTFMTIKKRIENLNYSFYYKKIRACDFNLPN